MKLCFVSAGSGGSEINEILINEFSKCTQYEIISIAITPYAKQKLSQFIYVEQLNIIDYLEKLNADVIINERSNDLDIQNQITKFATQKGILNIAILDLHSNYKQRFTERPHFILAPSQKIKQELLKEVLVNEHSVIVTGNPTFDKMRTLPKNNIAEKPFLFVSQPLTLPSGTSQFDVFNAFLNELLQHISPTVFVKMHPRENECEWARFIKQHPYKNIQLVHFNNRDNFWMELGNYALVLGFHSTLLLQCYYAGIPQISYLQNWKEQLKSYFTNHFQNKTIYDDFLKNATQNTVNAVEQIMAEWFGEQKVKMHR
jgi:hypothetical protein